MIKLVSWQSWVQTSTKDWLTAELLAGEIRDQREHVKYGIQVAGYFQAEREELKDMYRVPAKCECHESVNDVNPSL